MKRLKCPDCGGQVKLQTSPEGHVLGLCQHCAAEFLIETRGQEHIILEYRYPSAHRPPQSGGHFNRRTALGIFGSAALLGAGAVYWRRRALESTPAPPFGDLLFNVGGEGPEAGQFRDQVYHLGVDSLGRAALVDNRDRVSIFGPEGQFISQYALEGPREGKFAVVLPKGEVILAKTHMLLRLELESGALLETVQTKSDHQGWGAQFCPRAQGGFAAYTAPDATFGPSQTPPEDDHLILFNQNLTEERVLSGLYAQAIAADPLVQDPPQVTSIAMDPAGSIYLNIRAAEDHDLRGGIFEYNADGRLQRRIEVAQSWHGTLAMGQNQTLWYLDPWRSDLQKITPEGRSVLPLNDLSQRPETALGNGAALAVYPNGDLAITTMNHRFLRLRPSAIA